MIPHPQPMEKILAMPLVSAKSLHRESSSTKNLLPSRRRLGLRASTTGVLDIQVLKRDETSLLRNDVEV